MTYRTFRLIQVALLLVAGVGVAVAAQAPRHRFPADRPVPSQPTSRATADTPSEWSTGVLRTDDPFRVEREHPALRYDPDRPPPPLPPEPLPTPVRPSWRVTGILAGPNPLAVFDGLPAPDSTRLLQVGDTVEGRVVIEIARDTVRLAEGDSTWSFGLEAPWGAGGHR